MRGAHGDFGRGTETNVAPIHPGAVELCSDGVDNDCNGLADAADNLACPSCTDADGDGYFARAGCGTAADCKDNNAATHPGAAESCGNGIDDDCDARVDCADPDCAKARNCR